MNYLDIQQLVNLPTDSKMFILMDFALDNPMLFDEDDANHFLDMLPTYEKILTLRDYSEVEIYIATNAISLNCYDWLMLIVGFGLVNSKGIMMFDRKVAIDLIAYTSLLDCNIASNALHVKVAKVIDELKCFNKMQYMQNWLFTIFKCLKYKKQLLDKHYLQK